MSSMGRRAIHNEETARALLDAAERLVESDGLSALTVRRVADASGVSTRAVYSTFGSKEVLVGQLGRRAFALLGSMVAALPVTADPVVDLVAAGCMGFRRFAVTHPALFAVGVQQTAVPHDARQMFYAHAEHALAALHQRIQALQSTGGLGGRSLSDATWEFHAACEGLAAVEIRYRLPAVDAERIWNDALHSIVTGWTTTGTRHARTHLEN